MGIANGARISGEYKNICIDAKNGVWIEGKRYEGDTFNQQAGEVSFSSSIDMRAAVNSKDYAKQLNIKTENGLKTIILGKDKYLKRLYDEDGFEVSGQQLFDLLMDSRYSHYIENIDNALSPKSENFCLSAEDAIAEGKRLRETIIGGGAQNEKKGA